MTIETRAVCVLSMAHLKETTVLHLLATPPLEWGIMGGFMGQEMLTMHVAEDRAENVTDDLWSAMEWAHVQGFDYIMFDRDVDPAEDGSGLPDYASAEAKARTAPRLAQALHTVLDDLLGATDYGMPVSNPEHPFHESVKEARAALVAFNDAYSPTTEEN